MKKIKISVMALLLGGGSLLFSSCIGSFSLTNSVLTWNKEIGHKYVNELVFVAFWILPVYEVTALADLLVLNSIEFWRGDNPMTSSIKVVDTDHGRYLIACDGKGYTVTHEATGHQTRLDFDVDSQTWSIDLDGVIYPFMTFLDDNHVKMVTPEGDFRVVEISEAGVYAYSQLVNAESMPLMASIEK